MGTAQKIPSYALNDELLAYYRGQFDPIQMIAARDVTGTGEISADQSYLDRVAGLGGLSYLTCIAIVTANAGQYDIQFRYKDPKSSFVGTIVQKLDTSATGTFVMSDWNAIFITGVTAIPIPTRINFNQDSAGTMTISAWVCGLS
jgi:hypothetical protein